jgi:hypothetical protein
MKSLMAVVHRRRLVRDQRGLDAHGQVGGDARHLALDVAAEGQDVARIAHGDGHADGRLAVDAEHRLRRVGIDAAHIGDVAQPDDAVADGRS